MTNGQITLQGFRYQVGDAEGDKLVDGKPNGEKQKLKILSVADAHSQLAINFIFTPEQFEEFVAVIDDRRIIPAPGDSLSHFTRNGGIKG